MHIYMFLIQTVYWDILHKWTFYDTFEYKLLRTKLFNDDNKTRLSARLPYYPIQVIGCGLTASNNENWRTITLRCYTQGDNFQLLSVILQYFQHFGKIPEYFPRKIWAKFTRL